MKPVQQKAQIYIQQQQQQQQQKYQKDCSVKELTPFFKEVH